MTQQPGGAGIDLVLGQAGVMVGAIIGGLISATTGNAAQSQAKSERYSCTWLKV